MREPVPGLRPPPRRAAQARPHRPAVDDPRHPGTARRAVLARQRDQLLACDCFTVETLFLKTPHVMFFLELGTRRVRLAGCTAHPTTAWVAQQARNCTWTVQDEGSPCRVLIHDRDAKFSAAGDRVFAAEGLEPIRTPYRATRANAHAECWGRSAREECLDQILIVGDGHRRRVLAAYIARLQWDVAAPWARPAHPGGTDSVARAGVHPAARSPGRPAPRLLPRGGLPPALLSAPASTGHAP
ncbi:MAG: hypothetical protein M3Q65_20180 [Chloroflexota bacterium]|nr:hypothetical protein [Chloroflexota bacterium]